MDSESLFECAISRIYADSAVSALSLEQALARKTGCPLLARSLWAGFRQPRRQRVFGQALGIPHSNRPLVSVRKPDLEIIGFLSRRRRHLERSPPGPRLCSQPENANFLSETFPDRHLA